MPLYRPQINAIGISTGGSTQGNTGTQLNATYIIAATNNLVASQSTGTNGVHGLTISGLAPQMSIFAVSNTTQSTSMTANASNLSFHGAGIASVGASNGSVIISVPAGGGGGDGGVFAGVSTGGNTAGSTGTVSTGNFVLVGSSGITLSQSTAGAGSAATVTILGPGQGFTARHFPYSPPSMATSSAYSGATTTVGGGSSSTLSFYISPLVVDEYVSFDQVMAPMSATQSAGTFSQSMGAMWVLYTNNAGTLSSVSTWAVGARLSQNSATAYTQNWWWGTNSTSNSSSLGGNVSASFARLNQMLLATGGSSITPGQYWLAYAWSMSSNAGSIGWSRMCVSNSQTTMGSMYGTNVSSGYLPLNGIASTAVTSNAAHAFIFPSSIHSTNITWTGGSSQNQSNIIFFADT